MERHEFPITVSQRVRPTRIGFVVAPTDTARFRQIVRLNTMLWGGRYNPIIPFYRRRPRGEPQGGNRTGLEITLGYIDAFEPDVLVSAVQVDAESLQFDPSRFMVLDDFIAPENDDGASRWGTSVAPLYADLYAREFRFEMRHRATIVRPSTRERRMQAFVAACFGEFPQDAELRRYQSSYDNVFSAVVREVEPGNLVDVHRLGHPLWMGSYELDVGRGGNDQFTVFVMDGTRTADLIDYWNLRAIGWNVLPAPIQWLDALVEPFAKLARDEHRQHPRNPDYWFSTSVQKSQGVSETAASEFARRIAGDTPQRTTFTSWFPRFWSSWARSHDQLARVEVSAAKSDSEIVPLAGSLRFRELVPPFHERQPSARVSLFPWTKVVQFRQYGGDPWTAEVFPRTLERIDRLLGSPGLDPMWPSREGINLASRNPGGYEYWTVPRGHTVFESWMDSRGLAYSLSAPGKLVHEMVRRLDGHMGVSLIADENLIKFMNKMASGLVETEYTDSEEPARLRNARGNVVSLPELLSRLTTASNGNKAIGRGRLARLVDRRVVQLGLRVQCSQCSQWNWYPLASVREDLTCERCLQDFRFPLSAPPKDAWYYRTVGPFAVENFAQGAYAALLAFRFLDQGLFAHSTITPSFELKDSREREYEADFGLFWRRSEFDQEDPLLLLGECKSYNEFEKRDIDRMRALGALFPGSVLVFCTLRRELTPQEKRRIGRLALAGRKSLGEGRWRNPVLILTGVELFSESGVPHCWEAAGGRFARFANAYYVEREFNELCDVTQQLHLGVESRGEQRRKRE